VPRGLVLLRLDRFGLPASSHMPVLTLAFDLQTIKEDGTGRGGKRSI
jgi:hypothetical protein